ncbi:MAG: hypothetical protein ACTS2F_27405 [Thainema sp.]
MGFSDDLMCDRQSFNRTNRTHHQRHPSPQFSAESDHNATSHLLRVFSRI